jgi:hypothetical protein
VNENPSARGVSSLHPGATTQEDAMEKIIVVFEAKDMSPRQYAQVIKDLEQCGEKAPDGRSHHFASDQEGGMVVVDVWESQAKLERFAGILMPILVKNGVQPPRPQVRPLRNQVNG